MKATKSATRAAEGTIDRDAHLGGLARRLRQWRARQSAKGVLPVWVWDRAAQEAREQGVSRVARLLRLDYYKLQRRVAALPAEAGAKGGPAGFVELNSGLPPSLPSQWTLELFDTHGRKLTLRGPSEPTCWGEVVRAFWPEGA